MEKLIDRKVEFEGKIFNAVRAIVELDDGQKATRDIVEHDGGVGVVAYTGDSVLLIKQYRVAVEMDIVEIPAGKLEGDENPQARGEAELIEETGYKAGKMTSLGWIFPAAGFSTEKVHLYLAEDLEFVGQNLEWDEQIEVIENSIDEIKTMLENHSINDGKTVIALYRFLHRLTQR
jgi:ADP-ribose pyrophosphatase